MLLQQRQCEPLQPREALPFVLVADAGFVLAVSDVEGPMAGILDAPVSTHGAGELLNAHPQAADEEPPLRRLLAVAVAGQEHHSDGLQSLPVAQARQVL